MAAHQVIRSPISCSHKIDRPPRVNKREALARDHSRTWCKSSNFLFYTGLQRILGIPACLPVPSAFRGSSEHNVSTMVHCAHVPTAAPHRYPVNAARTEVYPQPPCVSFSVCMFVIPSVLDASQRVSIYMCASAGVIYEEDRRRKNYF